MLNSDPPEPPARRPAEDPTYDILSEDYEPPSDDAAPTEVVPTMDVETMSMPTTGSAADAADSAEQPTLDVTAGPDTQELIAQAENVTAGQQLFAERKCWLFKSNPDTYGIGDLEDEPDRTTRWDGVRNYQARNLLRDEIKRGDEVLLYHSRSSVPGVLGLATVTREGYPDPTQFDPSKKGFDPKSKEGAPIWYCVDIKLVRRLKRTVSLSELRAHPELESMMVTKRSARLSVQPVAREHFQIVRDLAED